MTVLTRTWLRPYDVGVRRDVRISVVPMATGPHGDDAVNLHVITVDIRRVSGTNNTWHRANTRFVGTLRRHLLGWRALSRRRKNQLFEEAAVMLRGTP